MTHIRAFLAALPWSEIAMGVIVCGAFIIAMAMPDVVVH
jgi:hypothetical protein